MTHGILESDYLRPYVERFRVLYGDAPTPQFTLWIQRKWRKFYAQHPDLPRGTAETRAVFLPWLNAEEA